MTDYEFYKAVANSDFPTDLREYAKYKMRELEKTYLPIELVIVNLFKDRKDEKFTSKMISALIGETVQKTTVICAKLCQFGTLREETVMVHKLPVRYYFLP